MHCKEFFHLLGLLGKLFGIYQFGCKVSENDTANGIVDEYCVV